MTEELMIEKVRIGKTEVEAIRKGGEGYVVLKRMCEAIGIDTWTQIEKIKKLHWAVTSQILATGPDGKKYECFCLHVKSVPLWAATIDVNKVKEDSREILIDYQLKAADALFRWSTGQQIETKAQRRLAVMRELEEEVEEERTKRICAEKHLAIAAPKADVYDAIANLEKLKLRSDVAKGMDEKPHAFCKWLRDEKIVGERDNKDPFVYQEYIDRKLMTTKMIISNNRLCVEVFVTSKGILYFTEKYKKYKKEQLEKKQQQISLDLKDKNVSIKVSRPGVRNIN